MGLADEGRLGLYQYRVRVADMYAHRDQQLAAGVDGAAVCAEFRALRDELFLTHPQSPLEAEDRNRFSGLPYFPYDSAAITVAQSVRCEPREMTIDLGSEGTVRLEAVALLQFVLFSQEAKLTLYWVDVYGGGLFLPFHDTTAGSETYGGGRYLVDTVKGTGIRIKEDGSMGLDFNYAYSPSCAYSPRWVCPLAPLENRLEFAVRAGEMAPESR